MKWIQLEMRKINLKPYVLTACLIPFISLFFIYFMAFIPTIDPSELLRSPELGTYAFIMQFSFLINVAGFVCLATTMLAKIVMEAYSKRNLYLTFSYPVPRKNILIAKLILCLSFVSIGVFLGILVTNLLFFLSESIFHVVMDTLHFSLIFEQLPLMAMAILLVSSIGILALYLGWLKQSIALTIISGIVMFSLPSNLMTMGNLPMISSLTIFLLILSLIFFQQILNKINRLEV